MATQPTNLPVPSESPRDLKFNAGKIDEFVTSLVNTYIDRFGNEHYTIEGLRWLAQQAIAQYGWIPVGTFQMGYTLTLPNQILKDETDGEYYRWDGSFLPDGKEVLPGSTPESTGGIGSGAWIGVGDSSLRTMLATTVGGSMVGLSQKGTVQDAVFSVTPQAYGALCDGVADDSDAVEAMMSDYPNHLIITIPPGSVLTIKRKLAYGGRRLEVRGYSGDMTNKVIGAESSQLYCNVPGDYAIQCTNADLFLCDVIIKGIPQYGNGTIGTNKGIATSNGNIKTRSVSWLGFDVPCQGINSFYVTFIDTDWLANKNGPDIQQAYNLKFIGGRAVDFNKFFPMSGTAGNGPISFIAMAFERWTNYVVGTDTAALIRPQNIAFKFCYFENMDDQSIYNGLTGRAGAATPGDTFYNKYAYARILVGTPTSLSMDETNTVYAKGLENACIAIDSWGIKDLVFKPKIVIPSDVWASHQKPLSMFRALLLNHVEVFNNNTASDGNLGFPFLSSDNSTLLPTIRSGVGISQGKTVLFNGFYNQTITFTNVAAGVNTYQDITPTESLDLANASVNITSRSAASAMATTQIQVISSTTLRVHITNGHTSAVTFAVSVVIPYAFK